MLVLWLSTEKAMVSQYQKPGFIRVGSIVDSICLVMLSVHLGCGCLPILCVFCHCCWLWIHLCHSVSAICVCMSNCRVCSEWWLILLIMRQVDCCSSSKMGTVLFVCCVSVLFFCRLFICFSLIMIVLRPRVCYMYFHIFIMRSGWSLFQMLSFVISFSCVCEKSVVNLCIYVARQ